MVEFLAGRLEEQKLLEKAVSNRLFQANAHFTIGVVRLAAGRREQAREHFEKAVTPRALESFEYEWARAYLERMEADPAWPAWIRDQGTK